MTNNPVVGQKLHGDLEEFMESERAKNLMDLYINTATFEVVSQVKIIEADVSRCINTHSDDSTPFTGAAAARHPSRD